MLVGRVVLPEAPLLAVVGDYSGKRREHESEFFLLTVVRHCLGLPDVFLRLEVLSSLLCDNEL